MKTPTESNHLRLVGAAIGALALSLTTGCFLFPKKATIVPVNSQGAEVANASVSVNGKQVGQGTTKIPTESGESSVTVDATPEYYPSTVTVKERADGAIRVPLRRDEIYALTIEDTNQVVNRWLTMNISDGARDAWWSVIINALGTQDMEMELMDEKSGFIRTAWKERKFGRHGIRRRFVGNIVTKAPLTWRLKYQVQRTRNGRDWKEYARGVKEEFDVIAEIRARVK